VIFGHLPGSYVTMNLTRELWSRGLTEKQARVVYLFGIAAGVVPDIDLLFVSLSQHRDSLTHVPLFWAGGCLAILLLSIVLKKHRRLLTRLVVAIAIGVLTHLLLDAIFTGVKIFYPFSNDYYRMLSPISWRYDNWIVNYVLHPIFLTEIYVFIVAGIILRRNRHKFRFDTVAVVVSSNKGFIVGAGLITALYALNWYVLYPLIARRIIAHTPAGSGDLSTTAVTRNMPPPTRMPPMAVSHGLKSPT